MLRRVAKLAVAVTVAGPSFSKAIEDADLARWAKTGGVGSLIQAAWTEGEAAEQGVVVSDDDAREAALPPGGGLTRQDRLYEARVQLLGAALKAPVEQAAAQSVTPQQIDEYVARHPRFLPEERTVDVMRLSDRATAERALAALKRRLSLAAATKRYRGRTRLLFLNRGEVGRPGLDRAIFTARRGKYVRYGIFVFRVKAIRAREPVPIDQQKAQAWERLAGAAQVRATREYEAAINAKWRPRTTCAATVTAKDFCSDSPTVQ